MESHQSIIYTAGPSSQQLLSLTASPALPVIQPVQQS